MAFNEKLAFEALPLRKDGPHGNAWGRWGDSDELGTLNLLTPDTTALAAKEIKDGVRVSVDWELDSMSPPCFGRSFLEHTITQKGERTVNDDTLTFNTQSSSQWDGLRHYGYQKEKLYYNGLTQEDVTTTKKNGIHGMLSILYFYKKYMLKSIAWVEKGGIVGRGVLLDYVSWAEENGISVNQFATTSIPVSTLKQVASNQGTSFRRGDILFIRTGWTEAYTRLSTTEQQTLAATYPPPAIGLESSEETLRWLWDNDFAAVVGDQPSFEAWPCQNLDFLLHEWVLAGWGMPIGELFDLKQLSEECRQRGRWQFFFSSMPLKVYSLSC